MKNKIIDVLLIFWQLPQIIVAWIIAIILNKHIVAEKQNDYVDFVCLDNIGGSFTLGDIVFMSKTQYSNADICRHEFGHTIQSKILGPLYLIVIGLPSLIHAWLWNPNKTNKSYYDFYTEKWANKLANVSLK